MSTNPTEKCKFMILTPSPEHNGGMWCSEEYPCKQHGKWKKSEPILSECCGAEMDKENRFAPSIAQGWCSKCGKPFIPKLPTSNTISSKLAECTHKRICNAKEFDFCLDFGKECPNMPIPQSTDKECPCESFTRIQDSDTEFHYCCKKCGKQPKMEEERVFVFVAYNDNIPFFSRLFNDLTDKSFISEKIGEAKYNMHTTSHVSMLQEESFSEGYEKGRLEERESIVKIIKSMKIPNISEMRTEGGEFTTPRMSKAIGYQNAIEELLANLKIK